jgi:ABC-2 type transport system permease protein
MNKLWVIAKKDIRESFRSRSTYFYIIFLFLFCTSYFTTYSSRMDAVIGSHASAEVIRQSSQALLNSFAASLPLMFSIWVCTIFATYSVVVEKAKHNIESLMVTPISIKQLWMGKSLAIALPSLLIGLGASIIVYLALNFFLVIPQNGAFLFPGVVSIICAVILVPIMIFVIIALVTYLQLTIANPRFANFIFVGIFVLLLIGINIMTGIGLTTDFIWIYLAVIVVCGAGAYLLSRFLTKERVMLSSKE